MLSQSPAGILTTSPRLVCCALWLLAAVPVSRVSLGQEAWVLWLSARAL
jgi:hypothetical protein